MDFAIGSTVGDYQVIGVLGAGGMGKVYKVRNTISDRVEAMKVLLPDLANAPELADRFVREIKVQASLEHPNIAALHTALRVENQLLMLMECVEGVTLEQKLKEGPIPVADAVEYIRQVLAALDYAHGRGVVHRDIKPANMMLTPSGMVKLMDFGIAKGPADQKLTMTGTTLGSLYYMSPEQIQGATTLDARSDLYSVGVSLYELVTGKRPFDGDSQFAIMSAHLQQTPAPPITLDPSMPKGLSDAILMSVSKDPNARFQTAGAFRNALGSVAPAQAAAAAVPFTPLATPMATPMATQTPAPPPNLATVPMGASAVVPPLAAAPPVMAAAMPVMVPQAPPPAGSVAPPAQPLPGDYHIVQPTPPDVPKRGHRGLWMALGALAMAAAVIGVIEFGPWKGSKAAQQQPVPTQQAPSQPAPAAQPGVPPPAAADSAPVATPQPVAQQAATPAPVPPPQTPPPNRKTARQGNAGGQTPAAGASTPPPQAEPTQPQPQAAEPQMPPPQPARPAFTLEQVQEAREEFAQMAARAGGVHASLDTMRNSLARQGLNLRGDIQTAATMLDTYMRSANDALRASDLKQAKVFMEKAETQLNTLEKFLNR